MDLTPGAYEYVAVDAVFGADTEGFVPLKRARVRFVAEQTVEGQNAAWDVFVNDDGVLEVRAIEGRVVIMPNMANSVGVRIESA